MNAKMQPFWWFKKPEAPPCPSGEQLTNEGFETGDLTGWVGTGDTYVTDEYKRSGNYSCNIDLIRGVYQTLAEPLLVDCVDVAELYSRRTEESGSGAFTVMVYFTDGSQDGKNDWAPYGEWKKLDFKDILVSGKIIERIGIINGGESTRILIDDVSLTGTG